MRMSVLVVGGSASVPAALTVRYWNKACIWVFCKIDVVKYCIIKKGEAASKKKKKILFLVLLIAYVNFMHCMHVPAPVTVLVNTSYTLSCTSLPHSSVTHLTALSACSARREAPAGLH